jgi:hypothetical protein
VLIANRFTPNRPIFRFSTLAAEIFAHIGRHPTPVLALPSLWFLFYYLPFWGGIDATVQLVEPVHDENILHFPPLYCFLARIPFFITDVLLNGHPAGIFERQHPSLTTVYALAVVQHIVLWVALRYFIFSIPSTDAGRGAATCFLASIASFYSFAHTCGSEAMTAVTYFLVFGAGMRAFSRKTWSTWVIYTLALLLAIGSRHINIILAGWLPGSAILLWLSSRFSKHPRNLALLAALCSLVAVASEKAIVYSLCGRFGLVNRSSIGPTLSDRIATWVDRLPAAEKNALLGSVQALTPDPLVKLAIECQIEIGAYYNGTGAALIEVLQKRGLSGEALNVEKERLIFESSLCFYQTLSPGLLKQILGDFWHGFLPTNDQGIAMTGPKDAFISLERISRGQEDWAGVSNLPMFVPDTAKGTFLRATKDIWIRHWRWVPILVWTLLFFGLLWWRTARGRLSVPFLLAGLSILGVGMLIYAASCVCVYTLPRYVLPLLISVIAFGVITAFASSPALDPSEYKSAKKEARRLQP